MIATPRYAHPEAIVSTAWLAEHLRDPALCVYDCTTVLHYETGTGRPYRLESGRHAYMHGHIPGSAFLDVQDELSDPAAPTNFMMPAPADLAFRFAAKGIGEGTRAILYSRGGMQWATRVWWMLRAIGFDEAAVLDGGFDKWSAEGRPVETAMAHYPAAKLEPAPRPGLFVGKEEVKAAISDPGACMINALAPDLHRGENPRFGRPGRIPGSVNLPASEMVDPATLTLQEPGTVAAAFDAVGADPSKRILLYCGGGIVATLNAFFLHQLGYRNIAVYDASMSEWAKDETLPIEVG